MTVSSIGGFPPGYEIDYAQITTATTSITATTEATANNIVSGNAITYDGSTTVIVHFFAPYNSPDTASAGRSIVYCLYDGSSSIGIIGSVRTPVSGTSLRVPVKLEYRLTPSNASHTYHIKAYVPSGTGLVEAGAGGVGNLVPAFIRITKA